MKGLLKGVKNIEVLSHYLWILPAALLILFFLVIPTFQTIYLSLHQKINFSNNKFKQELLNELKLENQRADQLDRKEITLKNLIQQVPGWKNAVNRLLTQYQIKILFEDINEEMTVRDTAELLIMTLNQAWEKTGQTQQFVGLKNYTDLFRDQMMLIAFKNNLLWLVLFTTATVVLGLLIAVLAERVPWATLAKTIIFLPIAISGAAAAVIWNFMYFKDVETGTINAAINLICSLVHFNFEGIAFLAKPQFVNLALIMAGVWMQVGFCVVIFSAALKAVPVELIEMARIEGAKSHQIFFRIELPLIRSTIVLVITQMIIWVLKIFDIIYALTKGGPFGSSEVIANRMYMTAFNLNDFQYASAMAVLLFVAVIPILLMNIRNLIYEETVRE